MPIPKVELGQVRHHLAIARREYARAVEHYGIASDAFPTELDYLLRRIFALCLADRQAEAQALVDDGRLARLGRRVEYGQRFFETTFGLRMP